MWKRVRQTTVPKKTRNRKKQIKSGENYDISPKTSQIISNVTEARNQ
jgi:hypothetical protein